MRPRLFLAVLTMVLSVPACAHAGKVVEYLFDGNANDTSGNAEHGLLVGNATFGAGMFGQALQLDGSGDYVSVAIGDYSFSEWTLECWVNVPTYSDNVHYISLQDNVYLILGDWANGPISSWASGINPVDADSTEPTPSTNAWHHFAFTYDGSTQRFFHDGVEVVTTASSGSLTHTSTYNSGLVIGARYDASTQYVSGLIDNARIWDEALSALELGYYADDGSGGCPEDGDGDGFGDPGNADCSGGSATDCDDSDSSVYPGATEQCDGVDSDCDGDLVDAFVDTDFDGEPDCWDLDDDGDGDPDSTDCVPLNGGICAGCDELCDTIDADCDGDYVDGFDDTDGDGDPDCTDNDDDGDFDPDSSDCEPLDDTFCNGCDEECDDLDSDCDGDLVDGFEDSDGDGVPDCVDGGDDDDASDDDDAADDDDASDDDDAADDDDASDDDDDAADDDDGGRRRTTGCVCDQSSGSLLPAAPGGLAGLLLFAGVRRRRSAAPMSRQASRP